MNVPNGHPLGPGLAKAGTGCLVLFLVPFFLGGAISLATGIVGVIEGSRDAFIAVAVGTLFLCVATGLLVAGLKAGARLKEAQARVAAEPERPWLWKPEWASGEITSVAAGGLWFIGFFALFWNAVSWTVAVVALSEMGKTGDKKILFVLIFPVIGLGLLWWFIYSLLRHRKFGISRLQMLSVPGVLGGTLRGAVEVPVQVDPPDGFKVRLICVRRVTSGSGKNRSTSEHVEWEDGKTVNKDLLAHDRTRTGIPVFFNIPLELPEARDGNPAIVWRLSIEGAVPGIDYAATFEVPVFRTEESGTTKEPEPDPTAPYQPNQGGFVWPEDSGIRRSRYGDAIEFRFPAGRNLGVSVLLLAFTAIWTGAIWFMIEQKAPLLFPIIFGLFDLVFVALLFGMLFVSTRFTADPAGLTLRWRALLLGGTTRLAPHEIRHIQFRQGMSSGTRVWYDLQVETKAGRRHRLGGGIPSRVQAVWMADTLSKLLDVPLQEQFRRQR
jgi:hypothetical protein